jgi:hypothetical protein
MSEDTGGDGTVDWSYSNAQIYDACPRQFFFISRPGQRTPSAMLIVSPNSS